MSLIKTGINVSKAFRNVGRLKEIVGVFAKNGFDEFLSQPLAGKIPNFILPKSRLRLKEALAEQSERNIHKILGNRLRLSFEELGPAFIKFGQLLCSREDLFHEEFIEEMQLLRDKVKPVPFEQSKEIIERSFGKKIEEVFKEFDSNAIGTASIGSVYKAELHDGSKVVVKVRRPNISKVIETDFSIVLFVIGQLEKASNEIKYLGITRLLNDFSISLQTELNFHIEAQNCNRFRENLYARDANGIFHVPRIYSDYVHEDVLVMERLEGIPFSDAEKINQHIEVLSSKLITGLQFFMKSFLMDGFFHADLHGGNFFYLDNGKIGIIDYGLMGTLSRKSRQNFIAIVYALLTFNYENLVYEFLDVADYEQIPDVDQLISDVRDALSPYIGLTVQQTNYSEVFKAIVATLNRHRLFLPRDWFIVFRSLITLDGVGKSLGIDFDIFGILEDDIKTIASESVSKDDIIEELVWTARDLAPFIRIIPRHLKWFVKDWSKKGFNFEVKNSGYESQLSALSGSLNFLGFTIMASIFLFSANHFIVNNKLVSWQDIPTISIVFYSLSFFTFVRGLFFINKD